MLHISYLLLLLVLAIASACDIKTRKIPNGLILTGLVTGVLFSPVGILTKLFGVDGEGLDPRYPVSRMHRQVISSATRDMWRFTMGTE